MSSLDELKKWIYQPVDQNIQADRLSICYTCESYIQSIHLCNECKCLVDVKTKLARQRCPLNKWLDVK